MLELNFNNNFFVLIHFVGDIDTLSLVTDMSNNSNLSRCIYVAIKRNNLGRYSLVMVIKNSSGNSRVMVRQEFK